MPNQGFQIISDMNRVTKQQLLKTQIIVHNIAKKRSGNKRF